MSPFATWFIALLTGGLLLLAAEIFVPGGLLGILGIFALTGAMALGFAAFGAHIGTLIAAAIVIGTLILLFVWLTYFSKSRMGSFLTLSQDGGSFNAHDASLQDLVGREGVAATDLRPAGIARLDRRRDVVSESGWIEKGKPIRVIHVDGNRIAVKEMSP